MNRASRRNIIIIGLIGFVLGAIFARPLAVAWLRPDATGTASAPAANNTITYAIILIDQFDNLKPSVDGVWLAWIPADFSTVELVGIPPAPYRDQYSHDIKGLPAFTIQQHIQGSLAGSIVLDRDDMAQLADQLGGVLLEGQRLDGKAMLAYYSNPDLSHQEQLFRQAAVLQSFIAQIALKGTSISYESLLKLPSLNTIQNDPMYETVRHYYPLRTDQVRIRTVQDAVQ